MITFDVDTVPVSPERLRKYASPSEAMLRQLGEGRRGRPIGSVEAAAANLEYILGNMENPDDGPEEFVFPMARHPFVESVHLAYSEHFPLELSPDDVWLCIAQGFGLHVNENAEALRDRFVQHQGQQIIRVRRDEFVKGSPDNDWQGVFAEFSDNIAGYIGKKRDLVVANFSTTGRIEKAVSEVVLMSAMQRYFDYRMYTLCGIPRITLLGTPEDWKSIRTRAAVLSEFDLAWWIEPLLPILDEFVLVSQGKVNLEFWRSMYKVEGGSGGPYVNGWIPAFFPYMMRRQKRANSNEPAQLGPVRNEGWFDTWKKHPENAQVTLDSFPKGFAIAPFIWEYLGAEIPMQFLGGFLGATQHPETGIIRPAMGWAVRETPRSPGSS